MLVGCATDVVQRFNGSLPRQSNDEQGPPICSMHETSCPQRREESSTRCRQMQLRLRREYTNPRLLEGSITYFTKYVLRLDLVVRNATSYEMRPFGASTMPRDQSTMKPCGKGAAISEPATRRKLPGPAQTLKTLVIAGSEMTIGAARSPPVIVIRMVSIGPAWTSKAVNTPRQASHSRILVIHVLACVYNLQTNRWPVVKNGFRLAETECCGIVKIRAL